MKKIVVDTNIVFSMLLSSNSKFWNIFFNDDDFSIYSVRFLENELFNYINKIRKLTKLTDEELINAIGFVFSYIHFIDELNITTKNLKSAKDLCSKIDEKDAFFVALALELDAQLWTGDKKLRTGLEKLGFNKFFDFE